MKLKFRYPVKCQNNHKAFWYCEVKDFGTIKNHGVPREQNCSCSKFNYGQGWDKCGHEQLFMNHTDRNEIEIYHGDIIDIHQTVNGCNLFVVVWTGIQWKAKYYFNNEIQHDYEYDFKELIELEAELKAPYEKTIEVVGNALYEITKKGE